MYGWHCDFLQSVVGCCFHQDAFRTESVPAGYQPPSRRTMCRSGSLAAFIRS